MKFYIPVIQEMLKNVPYWLGYIPHALSIDSGSHAVVLSGYMGHLRVIDFSEFFHVWISLVFKYVH